MGSIIQSISFRPDNFKLLQDQGKPISKLVNQAVERVYGANSAPMHRQEMRIKELQQQIEEAQAQLNHELNRRNEKVEALSEEKHEFLSNLGNMLVRDRMSYEEIHRAFNARFGDVSEEDFNAIKAEYGF